MVGGPNQGDSAKLTRSNGVPTSNQKLDVGTQVIATCLSPRIISFAILVLVDSIIA